MSPDEKTSAIFKVTIPEEGLTQWEHRFLKSLQEIDSIDFKNSSVGKITPQLRQFFIKLLELDSSNPSVRTSTLDIDYNIYVKGPDLLKGVRLTKVTIVYRNGPRLVISVDGRLDSSPWYQVQFSAPVDEEGIFICIPEKPHLKNGKTINVKFHQNGRPAELGYHGLMNGSLHFLDHAVGWDEEGKFLGKEVHQNPQPIRFRIGDREN